MSEDVQNRGICGTCQKIVPAQHAEHDGSVYLVKQCPDCGTTKALVSRDAQRYQAKRDLTGYLGEAVKSCSLNCRNCRQHKQPSLVFLDVTNRCNMNCPICLANIPAMGFRFDPPMAYFEKVFEALAKMDPKPKIQLFGGEPTVRNDLIDLINLGRQKYDLNFRVVTNGLRLADEEYCQKLLATRVQLMYSFDGSDPRIYERMRKHPGAREKKLQGLENVVKHHRNRMTIMCCVADEVNGDSMPDMIEFCHERRHCIDALDLIPLTAQWGPGEVDAESATIEDVERIMATALPGMEFVPAALFYKIKTLYTTFDMDRVTFGGAHPNCESVSLLISDGTRYRPASDYLKRAFSEVMGEIIALDERMAERLPRSLLGRLFGRAGRKLVYGMALLKLMRRSVNLREVFGGSVIAGTLKVLWGLVRGVKMKLLLRRHTKCHYILRVIILPFEETGCVESARLVDCPAAFAFEHPESDEIRLMPVCAWAIHKNEILRRTAERYGVAKATGDDGVELTQQAD